MRSIEKVLEIVFGTITNNATKNDFVDHHGYSVVEVVFEARRFGIGLSQNKSRIKLFIIDEREKEKSVSRFCETFCIGRPPSGIDFISIELERGSLYKHFEHFSETHEHIRVLNDVFERIHKNFS